MVIKLYHKVVQACALSLAYANSKGVGTPRDLNRVATFLADWEFTPDEIHVICNSRLGEESLSQKDIMKELAKQLMGFSLLNGRPVVDGGSDLELLDELVRVIGLPFSKNILSGRTLSSMRQMMLTPGEYRKLITTLREREMTCPSCGRKFEPGEAVNFQPGPHPNGSDGAFVVCFNCEAPSVIPTKDGQGTLDIDRKFIRSLQKVQASHAGPQEEVAPERELTLREELQRVDRELVGLATLPLPGRRAGRLPPGMVGAPRGPRFDAAPAIPHPPPAAFQTGELRMGEGGWVTYTGAATDNPFTEAPTRVFPPAQALPEEVEPAGEQPAYNDELEEDDELGDNELDELLDGN